MSEFMQRPPEKSKETFNNSADRRRRGVEERKSPFRYLPVLLFIFFLIGIYLLYTNKSSLFQESKEDVQTSVHDQTATIENPTEQVPSGEESGQ